MTDKYDGITPFDPSDKGDVDEGEFVDSDESEHVPEPVEHDDADPVQHSETPRWPKPDEDGDMSWEDAGAEDKLADGTETPAPDLPVSDRALTDTDDDDDWTWTSEVSEPPSGEQTGLESDVDDAALVDRDDETAPDFNAQIARELDELGEDRYPFDNQDTEQSAEPENEAGESFVDEDSSSGTLWKTDRDDEPASPYIDSDDEYRRPGTDPETTTSIIPDSTGRWPLALLGVAAIAIALLAVGGYGVLSERAELREEIRQLQATLATTARSAPDTIAAETRIAELGSELAVLASENSALRERIADLRSELSPRDSEDSPDPLTAAVDPESMDSSTAVAERDTPKESTTVTPESTEGTTVPVGDWFVNFSSYSNRNQASRRAAELSVDVGRVVVQDAVSGGRTVYRVRVVDIENRNAAEAIARKLETAYKLPKLWIGRE